MLQDSIIPHQVAEQSLSLLLGVALATLAYFSGGLVGPQLSPA